MPELPVSKAHSSLRRLVEHQIKQWETDKLKLLLESQQKKKKKLNTVITCSRQIGALGEETAALVAKSLNFQLLDREILEAIAKTADDLKAVLDSIDELGYTWLEEQISAVLPSIQIIHRAKFFKHLCEVVLVSARHGNVVMVGRGANLILKDPEVLRVRMVAPIDLRVERTMQAMKLDKIKAKKLVQNSDKRRKIFISSHFKVNLDEPSLYDLIINTAFFTPQDAADLIITAFKSKKVS